MEIFANAVLNGLTVIGILALIGLGLTISFGLMNVTNLAHGEFVTVGAFTVYFVQSLGGSFWLALVLAPLVAAIAGMALEWLVLRHLYERPAAVILATLGASLIIQQSLEFVFGHGAKPVSAPFAGTVDLGITTYPAHRIVVILVSLLVLAGVQLVMRRTGFGLDMRTVIQNRDMAEAVGINTRRTFAVAFAFGAALAGLAGALIAPLASVLPQMGVAYLANAFFVVIVGGAGSVGGVLAGSSFIGGLTTFFNYQLDPSLSQALVLLAAIVMVRLRPYGIVAIKGRQS